MHPARILGPALSLLALLPIQTAVAAVLDLEDLGVPVLGVVTDPDGLPVAGATVTFIDRSAVPLQAYQTQTDALGRYGNVSVGVDAAPPSTAALRAGYPNPFLGVATLEIAAPDAKIRDSADEIGIHDLRGRRVGWVPATVGTHAVRTGGGPLAFGSYLFRFGDESRLLTGTPERVRVLHREAKEVDMRLAAYLLHVQAPGLPGSGGTCQLDDGTVNQVDITLTADWDAATPCMLCHELVTAIYLAMAEYGITQRLEIEWLLSVLCPTRPSSEHRDYCSTIVAAYHTSLVDYCYITMPAANICVLINECEPGEGAAAEH